MKYYVTINKPYKYVRVYNIVKKLEENRGALSRWASNFVEKLFAVKKSEKGM
jgi:hypothetical protein